MADRVIRGILGTKLGMTQVFDENNRVVPVTVVKAGPCVVTQVRTPDVDGYSAVQLAFGEIDPRKVPKPLRGHFEKAGVTPRRHIVELRTAGRVVLHRGPRAHRAGLQRRRGRRRHRHQQGQGLRRCHEAARLQGSGLLPRCREEAPLAGLHRWLRHSGPRLQGRQDGRPHGQRAITTLNLVIHAVDAERGLLLVRGAVPGPDGGLVLVRSASKRVAPDAFEPAAESSRRSRK